MCDKRHPGQAKVTIHNCFKKHLDFAVAEYTDPMHPGMSKRVCTGKR